eukprot:1146079-Pelagomonas_calceolata.AAC.2
MVLLGTRIQGASFRLGCKALPSPGCKALATPGCKPPYSPLRPLPLFQHTVASATGRELNTNVLDQDKEGLPSSTPEVLQGAALEHQWQRQQEQERLQFEEEPSVSQDPSSLLQQPYGPIAAAADPRLFLGASLGFMLTSECAGMGCRHCIISYYA